MNNTEQNPLKKASLSTGIESSIHQNDPNTSHLTQTKIGILNILCKTSHVFYTFKLDKSSARVLYDFFCEEYFLKQEKYKNIAQVYSNLFII